MGWSSAWLSRWTGGYRVRLAVDTDYDGWELPDGTWDEPRMARLLVEHPDVVVSGTVPNQGNFYDRFEHVVLLSAPLEVLLQRVASRITNPYGKTPRQQADIRHYVNVVEPLLRLGASLELDGRLPVTVLADHVERLTQPSPDIPLVRTGEAGGGERALHQVRPVLGAAQVHVPGECAGVAVQDGRLTGAVRQAWSV